MKYEKLNIFPIIGLMGKARSGKDTVAAMLFKNFDINRVAFADALKNKVMCDFGLTVEQVYGDEKEIVIEKYKMSPRQILQKVGTDWYRTIYENYWVDEVYNSLQKNFLPHSSRVEGICITDVRFDNEIKFVKDIGGIIVKVTRPDLVEISSNNHISETALNSYKDYALELINDGTLDDLEKKVIEASHFF